MGQCLYSSILWQNKNIDEYKFKWVVTKTKIITSIYMEFVFYKIRRL